MQRKKKHCIGCDKDKYLFSNGLCEQCYKIANPIVLKKTAIKKSNKPIKKISLKERDRQKKYKLLRDEHLKTRPLCEANIMGCTFKAVEIHHIEGRDGDNLFKSFLGVCRHCHDEIELNPEWAREHNFIRSRIKK